MTHGSIQFTEMCTEGGEGHPNLYALYALSTRYCHLQYVVNGFMGHKPSGGWETTGIPAWKPSGFLLIQRIDVEVFDNNYFNCVQIFQKHKCLRKKDYILGYAIKATLHTPHTHLQRDNDCWSYCFQALPRGYQPNRDPSPQRQRNTEAGRNPNKRLRGSS